MSGAEAVVGRVLAEINRLEGILSLFRTDSALAQLNRQGFLTEPPFELLECLSIAGAVNHAKFTLNVAIPFVFRFISPQIT